MNTTINTGSATGIGIYANEPPRSLHSGLALSFALHILAGIALVQVDSAADPTLARPLARTSILVAPRSRPRTPPPARLPTSPLRPRIPEQAPAPIPGARAFAAPSPRGLVRASIAIVELPSVALDLPLNPPVFATPAHLPVLAAPPLKTDNLARVASSLPVSVTGRMEAAGFGAATVTRAYSTHAPPSTMAGFSAATLEKVAPPDPALPSRAGFGDASVSSTTLGTARMPIVAAQDVSATPVEILEKPRPLYSEEARRLRLEGEVLVEALFPAAGPAKVLRVLRGLGHGLDESAMAAVQGIRFRPAKRAGQAVDSSAIVHIVFQIAY